MTLKRVLFVDDDLPILESLQRLLRKERSRWDMKFASSGAAALAEMERAPVDVVVTDMRMPGMDGAELLARVKERYPSTARLVLSGHAEQEAIIRALAVAQQFLSKPCEGETLRIAIERTCDLHRLLEDPALRNAVGGMTRLPAAATTFAEVSRLASDVSAGANDIARVMERDPAMSAKVLQLVNSAFFGIPQHIASVKQAVVYLGVGLIRALVLSAQVFGGLDQDPRAAHIVEAFQQRSLRVAQLARRFLRDPKKADEAFTAGLLHDIGAVVLALELTPQARRIDVLVEAGQTRIEAEVAVLGVTHAEVGACLLGAWGLPFPLIEVAAYHHRPGAITEGPGDAIAAVHVADALLGGGPDAPLDLEFLERVGLIGELPRWRELAEAVRAAVAPAA